MEIEKADENENNQDSQDFRSLFLLNQTPKEKEEHRGRDKTKREPAVYSKTSQSDTRKKE